MCKKLINQKELFESEFLDILVGLQGDKVINVKLILASIVK